ncbi:MAG: hypothetical protein ABF979_12680 [Gluconobacter sp.]|uniref:hypothetical protein n=1 Tax=Gluconobacter sp. TaxID=1876758 RepID=UPI0039EAA4FB
MSEGSINGRLQHKRTLPTPLTQQTNPLEFATQAIGVRNALLGNKIQQAKYDADMAQGNALLGATSPDGRTDYAKARATMAADPAAAYGASRAVREQNAVRADDLANTEAWTFVNDTVNSAGREIDRTFGVGVPHLVNWATSLGHHMDNPVSRAAHDVGDWVASKEDGDEAARKSDYGAPYTDAAGTMLGAGLATALGGRVVRPAAAALDETRAGRVVANALTGEGPSAMKYANNALAAGVQTGLAGGDWKDVTALTLGLGAGWKARE